MVTMAKWEESKSILFWWDSKFFVSPSCSALGRDIDLWARGTAVIHNTCKSTQRALRSCELFFTSHSIFSSVFTRLFSIEAYFRKVKGKSWKWCIPFNSVCVHSFSLPLSLSLSLLGYWLLPLFVSLSCPVSSCCMLLCPGNKDDCFEWWNRGRCWVHGQC